MSGSFVAGSRKECEPPEVSRRLSLVVVSEKRTGSLHAGARHAGMCETRPSIHCCWRLSPSKGPWLHPIPDRLLARHAEDRAVLQLSAPVGDWLVWALRCSCFRQAVGGVGPAGCSVPPICSASAPCGHERAQRAWRQFAGLTSTSPAEGVLGGAARSLERCVNAFERHRQRQMHRPASGPRRGYGDGLGDVSMEALISRREPTRSA